MEASKGGLTVLPVPLSGSLPEGRESVVLAELCCIMGISLSA